MGRRLPIRHVLDRDVLAAVLIVGLLAGIAAWNRVERLEWLGPDQIDHLGAEYDSIAQAIRQGRGFADPFRTESGPTAWMPPVLPAITALLYWLTGDDRQQVVWIVYGLQLLVVTWTAWLVLRFARCQRIWWVGVATVIAFFCADFHALFQITHDTLLILACVNGLWLGLCREWLPRCDWRVGAWGVFGGSVALVNPVVGATWAVLTTWKLWPIRRRRASGDPDDRWSRRTIDRNRATQLACAAVLSMIVVAPWAIRNRLVLGRWVPIKSNAIYEIWQSLCLDTDGVLDMQSIRKHPWLSAGAQRRAYVEKGEIGFLDSLKQPVWEKVTRDPWSVIERILNRWSAACLWYEPFFDDIGETPWLLIVKRVVFALPLPSLLAIVLLGPDRLPRPVSAAIGIYVVYLIPYVLISYYERYGAPLVGIKCLIVLAAAAVFRSQLFGSRSSSRSRGSTGSVTP
ncbi:MAG: hypothetical protein KatS3mg111_3992 [Pirellulaceae bacterium]|nr:MAG: hypothetical protein KatS3mg111_3992 [Pirellulaceae bacterium]